MFGPLVDEPLSGDEYTANEDEYTQEVHAELDEDMFTRRREKYMDDVDQEEEEAFAGDDDDQGAHEEEEEQEEMEDWREAVIRK